MILRKKRYTDLDFLKNIMAHGNRQPYGKESTNQIQLVSQFVQKNAIPFQLSSCYYALYTFTIIWLNNWVIG